MLSTLKPNLRNKNEYPKNKSLYTQICNIVCQIRPALATYGQVATGGGCTARMVDMPSALKDGRDPNRKGSVINAQSHQLHGVVAAFNA